MARISKQWLGRVSPETVAVFTKSKFSREDVLRLDEVVAAIAKFPDPVLQRAFEIYDEQHGTEEYALQPLKILLIQLRDCSNPSRFGVDLILDHVARGQLDHIIEPHHILDWALCRSSGGEKSLRRNATKSGINLRSLAAAIEDAEKKADNAGVCDRQGTFKLWIDPGSASADQLSDVLTALSNLNRACGGNGLIFARDNSQQPIIPCCHA